MTGSASYQHLSPGKLFVGTDSSADLVRELPKSETYLIVTDRGLAGAGAADRLADNMEQAGLSFHVFAGVVSDPPIEVVEKALETAGQKSCTAVLGLGGGSSLDAAKALAIRMRHDAPLREYGDGRLVEGPIAPLYAIPTTAGNRLGSNQGGGDNRLCKERKDGDPGVSPGAPGRGPWIRACWPASPPG